MCVQVVYHTQASLVALRPLHNVSTSGPTAVILYTMVSELQDHYGECRMQGQCFPVAIMTHLVCTTVHYSEYTIA